MNTLGAVSSELIARNESWVRKEAGRLSRRLPSNVEKADLIQVGLIAVAHASLLFEWEGDLDSDAARMAFVGYARQRVKGAMLDELRQMDHIHRSDRRSIKALQIARDRWRSLHGGEASLAELSQVSALRMDEIARLDELAEPVQSDHQEGEEFHRPAEAATEADEVEARVDTAIVMRRLATFFATLSDRDREVIDAYLGIGLTPVALAQAMQVTPSRVSQLYRKICTRIATHFGTELHDTGDRRSVSGHILDLQIAAREARGAARGDNDWSEALEQALIGQPATGTSHAQGH